MRLESYVRSRWTWFLVDRNTPLTMITPFGRPTLYIGCGFVLAAALNGCGGKRPARMYDGPERPRSETSRIVVQPEANGVMLRIEAIDGVRMPNATRKFYDQDTEAFVRAGNHTVEIRGWAAGVGPPITFRGDPADIVFTTTLAPRTLKVAAQGGHDYEIQATRAPFDAAVRHVAVPQQPMYTEEWLMTVVELPSCPECP